MLILQKTTNELLDIFTDIDKDGSGELSKEELCQRRLVGIN